VVVAMGAAVGDAGTASSVADEGDLGEHGSAAPRADTWGGSGEVGGESSAADGEGESEF